jgi:signal recognition particle subunit SRP54
MLDNLTQRLSGVIKTLRGQARLTESNIQDALREVRMALLEADVALPVVKEFIAQVKQAALGQEVIGNLNPGQALIGVVHRELTKLMGEHNDALNLAAVPPAVILMAGLQGAGKTTTSGKLAKLLRDQQKKKVLLVSCDVYRPAAIAQLQTLAKQLEVDFFESDISQKPQDIVLAALDFAKRHYHDVLIVDTAGRLAIDEAMMAEIKQLHAALKPIETLFVVDAMTGQDAVNTAKAFNEAVGVTGIVMTRMDGDARGGAALSMRAITGAPIKLVGTGEKLDALEEFHPERVAGRILGMGDVVGLVERAAETIDEAEAEKLARKMAKGTFDLEDYASQLKQISKMGRISSILGMLPGAEKLKAQIGDKNLDTKVLKRQAAIISSMTAKERRLPEIIKASRKKRIAAGSGTTVQEINKLLKQFDDMSTMMKRMNKLGQKGLMRQGLSALMPQGRRPF